MSMRKLYNKLCSLFMYMYTDTQTYHIFWHDHAREKGEMWIATDMKRLIIVAVFQGRNLEQIYSKLCITVLLCKKNQLSVLLTFDTSGSARNASLVAIIFSMKDFESRPFS